MTEQTHPEHIRTFETYETVVEQADLITPRNIHVRFRLPAGKEMHFKAGQFVQIFVPQPGAEKPRRSSYSIASPARFTEFFELCVTHVDGGRSSGFIHSLKVGDKVTAMGPLGKFGLPVPANRDIVFIATGSGIAPFRSMIDHLIQTQFPKNIYLLFGNRFDGDIIYQKDWEKLSQDYKNFKHFFTLSRPTPAWPGPKGYVGEKIQEFVPNPTEKDFFICGLSNMINAVQEKLLAIGVPQSQIHFEKYD